MAITRVGSAIASATTITLPAHVAGDLIVIFAYNGGANTVPTVPSPFAAVAAGTGGNTNASVVGSTTATGSGTTSGTWTNATKLVAVVYRGTNGAGAIAGTSGNAQTSISYPALTLTAPGLSWVMGVAGHRTSALVETAPAGMTNITSTGGAAPEAAAHDTNAAYATNWPATSANVTTSGAYRSWTLEILAFVVAGTVALTEADDALSSDSTVAQPSASVGDTAATEAVDTASSAAAIALQATLGVTESADTIAASAGLAIQATLAWVEVADTLAAVGMRHTMAALAAVEAADVVDAQGGGPGRTGTFAVIEAADIGAATTSLVNALVASATLVEANDNAASIGSAAVPKFATAAFVETADVLRFTGWFGGSIGLLNDPDRLAAVASDVRSMNVEPEPRMIGVEGELWEDVWGEVA